MPSPLTILFFTAMFTLLGLGWIKGYDLVKRKAPDRLVTFYMVYAAFRMVAILLAVGVYALFISQSLAESKAVAMMVLAMYAAMMALTLKKKH